MRNRIPSIPSVKVKALLKYADNPDNWIDTDAVAADMPKHIINHQGFQIIYTVDYKNNEDDSGGKLPLRHLSFQLSIEIPKDTVKDFIARTVKQFGFVKPRLSPGKRGRIHYHEPMFDLES